MTDEIHQQRLQELRKNMRSQQLDLYYVPEQHCHFTEYMPPCWKRRGAISGFTGSSGDLIVGLEHAWLWTDSRYAVQSKQELDLNCFDIAISQQAMPFPMRHWLLKHAIGMRIGYDPQLISMSTLEGWRQAFVDHDIELVAIDDNLVDQIWHDQPDVMHHPVSVYPQKHAGSTVQEKLQALRAYNKKCGVNSEVITTLDAVCWLFNIRGTDIAYNPFVFSYGLVTVQDAFLFVNLSKVSDEVRQHLTNNGVTLKAYDQFAHTLQTLTGRVLIDPDYSSQWIAHHLSAKVSMHYAKSSIQMAKACKNKVEQAGMQEAHRKDALALIKFFSWLDQHGLVQSELSVAERLLEFRKEDTDFKGGSFETISAFADHGAIIHYMVTKESNYQLTDQSLLLLDSGGQYNQGTTDVTRTIHLGNPSEQHIRNYTLVLKGHLALGHVIFPHGTCGEQLDVLARMHLWSEKLSYDHGTGHGVGCYLGVHEGPQGISGKPTNVPLLPGMMVSNEPGVYFTGHYGIRIENVCVVKQVFQQDQSPTGHGPFYQLSDLTLVPYARNLINKDLLCKQDIAWINEYHQRIEQELAMDLDLPARRWLQSACQPL